MSKILKKLVKKSLGLTLSKEEMVKENDIRR